MNSNTNARTTCEFYMFISVLFIIFVTICYCCCYCHFICYRFTIHTTLMMYEYNNKSRNSSVFAKIDFIRWCILPQTKSIIVSLDNVKSDRSPHKMYNVQTLYDSSDMPMFRMDEEIESENTNTQTHTHIYVCVHYKTGIESK